MNDINTKKEEKKEEKPYLFLYWENRVGSSKPPYLELCFETIQKHASPVFNVVLLNEISVVQFLPHLPYDKLNKLHHLAQKADCIRVAAVLEYGGWWLDSDTIMLKTPFHWVDLLKEYDFVWGTDQCFGARKGSVFLKHVMQNITNKLKEPRLNYDWTELGRDGCIEPVFSQYKEKINIFNLNEKDFWTTPPIPHYLDVGDQAFTSERSIDSCFNPEQIVVRLHNQMYSSEFKKRTKEDILKGKSLIGSFIRYSMQ